MRWRDAVYELFLPENVRITHFCVRKVRTQKARVRDYSTNTTNEINSKGNYYYHQFNKHETGFEALF